MRLDDTTSLNIVCSFSLTVREQDVDTVLSCHYTKRNIKILEQNPQFD